MSDIAELGRRISSALDTIEGSVKRIPSAETMTELEDLRIELEAERKASSLLEERVTALRRSHDERVAGLEAEVATAKAASAEQAAQGEHTSRVEADLEEARKALEERDGELEHLRAALSARESELKHASAEAARLREALDAQTAVTQQVKRSNGEMRATMRTLREAQTAGLTDAHLINQAVLTELEALRVAHETDRAEMDEILSAMEPILGEIENA